MSLDPYKPCPCGSGKKIKFCCCKDIAADVEKVVRALEGEQRAAALDQINRLLASKGERPALLALKGEVQIQTEQLADARATADRLFDLLPESPVALALSAALESDNTAAVMKLQRAFEKIDEEIPFVVYHALAVVGHALLLSGEILAARRHLAVQASLAGESDPRPLEQLIRIQSSTDVPLLLKDERRLAERPADVAWGTKFDEAVKLASRGTWLAAVEILEDLAKEVPDSPAILKNIAIFRSWLANNAALVAAWRRYAEAKGLPLDEAVEAEALAQLLDTDAESGKVDFLSINYPVEDTDRLKERLLSDLRANQMPVDLSQLGSDDEPSPNAAFWLLDRPLPASSEGLTREAVPHVLGELFLFGRQTNRPARLEFNVTRDEDFDLKQKTFSEVLGDLVGPPEGEEVTGNVPAASSALTWNWRFPDDTPLELRSELIAEQRREVMLNKWPDIPLPALDGKTPNEAAAGFSYQIKLLSAILLLELAGEHQDLPAMDFNELRRKLNLPTRDPIDPNEVNVPDLSLVQLAQLEVEKLSDDDLVEVFHRAVACSAVAALRKLGVEITRREHLADRVNMANVYEMLADITRDNEEAFQYIGKARDAAVAAGESPAPLLLTEMKMRLERREVAGCEEILSEIRTRHINEPGIAQGLYNILVNFGIISPDGTPAGPPPADAAVAVSAAEPSASKSQLWTPGGDQAQPAQGQGKSKLWVPGMD